MPPLTNLFLIFTDPLNQLGIRYMVTGSVASIIYGIPRVTHDVDVVIELSRDLIPKLQKVFPENKFYFPPVEILRVEMERAERGHFNLIHQESGFKADMYLAGTDRLHEWAMAKRRKIDIGESYLWAAPPEYVILRKLEYYREGGSEKHLKDIRAILEQSGKEINFSELEKKIFERGLGPEWAKIAKP